MISHDVSLSIVDHLRRDGLIPRILVKYNAIILRALHTGLVYDTFYFYSITLASESAPADFDTFNAFSLDVRR